MNIAVYMTPELLKHVALMHLSSLFLLAADGELVPE